MSTPKAILSTIKSLPRLINGKNASMLAVPNDFYSNLRHSIGLAKSEVILSALYVGTGNLERQLMSDIEAALSDPERPELTVTFILDYSRAQRPSDSSLKLYDDILQRHHPRLRMFLYRMPQLKKIPKLLLPSPVDEVLGVYHCKFCVFDNSFIVTGANLSDEYFTNRKDRYMVYNGDQNKSKENEMPVLDSVLSYLKQFSLIIREFSFEALPHCHLKEPNENCDRLLKEKLELLNCGSPNVSSEDALKQHELSSETSTLLFPVMQHRPIGLEQEYNNLPELLLLNSSSCENSSSGDSSIHWSDVYFSTPYPSFYASLRGTLLSVWNSGARCHFVLPSESSHGFRKGSGLRGLIPEVHRHTFSHLTDKCVESDGDGLSKPLNLMHYHRDNWTFHAKGIWLFRNESEGNSIGSRNSPPSVVKNDSELSNVVSYIGSSNFGERSMRRDFELGFILYSSDNHVQKLLHDEVDEMEAYNVINNEDITTEQPEQHILWKYGISLLAYVLRPFI